MNTCLKVIKKDRDIPKDQKKLLNAILPDPFCFNRKGIKAIVLGADPTNFSDSGSTVFLDTVFGVGSEDSRYFHDILNNLNIIGLHLEDIYVQNVVRNYMADETGKNKLWEKFAEIWLPSLKEELNEIDPTGNIPVLVTAERIMKFLILDTYKLDKASVIYNNEVMQIPASSSKVGRPMIALYRHYEYKLSGKQRYADSLRKLFE